MKTKYTLGLLCLSLNPIYAHAQAVDVNTINQRATNEVVAVADQNQSKANKKIKKTLGDIYEVLTSGLSPQIEYMTKKRALTQTEEDQLPVLECVDQILNNFSGGYEAPQIAFEVLRLASNNNGWSADKPTLDHAIERCHNYLAKLSTFSKGKIDKKVLKEKIAALPVENAADKKSIAVIKALGSKRFQHCVRTYADARVSVVAGLGTGVEATKCILTNGEMRVYAGPRIWAGAGLGAVLTAGSKVYNAGEDISSFGESDPMTIGTASFELSLRETELAQRMSVGLALNIGGSEDHFNVLPGGKIMLGLPLPHGKRHWEVVLDLLK